MDDDVCKVIASAFRELTKMPLDRNAVVPDGDMAEERFLAVVDFLYDNNFIVKRDEGILEELPYPVMLGETMVEIKPAAAIYLMKYLNDK